MKVLFLVSCLALVAVVAVAAMDVEMDSSDEWVQPSFVETLAESAEEAFPVPNRPTLPAAGKPCGAGLRGVCSAKAIWCNGKVPVPGQCANGAVCCTPRAAPAQIPNAPTPTTTAPSTTVNRGASVAGPVIVTADTGSYTGSLPTGDLSDFEAAVDGGREEAPLTNDENSQIQSTETKVKAVVVPNPPKMTYIVANMAAVNAYDQRLSLNGAPVPRVMAASFTSTPSQTQAPIPVVGAVPTNGLCGAYAGQAVTKIAGNKGVVYEVVKILPQHAEDRSMLTASPAARDNTMRTVTACAFDKMHEAAKKVGVNILIASGFRTHARQLYFWNCYQKKNCNKGRKAARPGSSNHGVGIALDLNQSASGVYSWLAKNAQTYGFVRTVAEEKWHWEYRPGTPKARYT